MSLAVNLLHKSDITTRHVCVVNLIILGIAYCGVIGDIARRYYAIIGPPVDKAIRIMDISYDKVISSLTKVLKSLKINLFIKITTLPY